MIVRPTERVVVDFDAGNPGRWMLHCDDAYHAAGDDDRAHLQAMTRPRILGTPFRRFRVR